METGEQLLITRHGRAVARLIPVELPAAEERIQAIELLRRFRRVKTLAGLSLQELRDEGRKG